MSEQYPCPGGRYHNFRVASNKPDATIEVCRYCGLKAIHKITPQGRLVNAKRYRELHVRDFCQPGDKVFEAIYGYGPEAQIKADAKKRASLENQRKARLEEGQEYLRGNKTVF